MLCYDNETSNTHVKIKTKQQQKWFPRFLISWVYVYHLFNRNAFGHCQAILRDVDFGTFLFRNVQTLVSLRILIRHIAVRWQSGLQMNISAKYKPLRDSVNAQDDLNLCIFHICFKIPFSLNLFDKSDDVMSLIYGQTWTKDPLLELALYYQTVWRILIDLWA